MQLRESHHLPELISKIARIIHGKRDVKKLLR